MTQMRYADPRLWSEGGLTIPLKPGTTYHLDDNGPPGIEARFDNSSTPMPLGPGATFKVPDGNGMTAFRMGMWRRGAPDFNASIVTNMAPQAGTTPEAYFLRNAQFQLREGWYSGPNGLLPGDGPLFVHAFDGTQKVIPLLAFFTAAQLARAKSLVIDYGSRPPRSIDNAACAPYSDPVITFYMRHPGAGGTGIAWSGQHKRWGAHFDETNLGKGFLWRNITFVMRGPFSPLDCLHVEDYAGAATGPGATYARFALKLSEMSERECVMGEIEGSLINPALFGGWIHNTVCIFSDRMRSLTAGAAFGVIGSGATISMQSANFGTTRAAITAVANVRRGMIFPRGYQGRCAISLNSTASESRITDLTFNYADGPDETATMVW